METQAGAVCRKREEMKGFRYIFRGKEQDINPCFFCKHRDKRLYEHPCCDCLDDEDIALHHPNYQTEFFEFEAINQAYLDVVSTEQESL